MLKRNIPVLLRWILVALGVEHLQRVDQFLAGLTRADDRAVLLLRAGQESGDVFKGDQRDIEGVTEADEAGALHAGVDVEYASQKRRLIGDDAYGASVQPCEADHDVLRVMLVHFEEI